jgi:Predicted membrane protein
VDKLSVLLVALFAVAFLHERLAWREWAGLAMTSGGVLRRALRR